MPNYEYHAYKDPRLKVFFHTDHLSRDNSVWLHWHKSPEFLYVLEGEISVTSNGIQHIYGPGEIAIINSNEMHFINTCDQDSIYHCLIADLSICDLGRLPARSNDSTAILLYKTIASELAEKKHHYRHVVMELIRAMETIFSRESDDINLSDISSRKYDLTKAAIQYLYDNYQRDISLDEISNALNLNKYYLSHIFKETTGRTILSHLNYIRCINAQSLLSSGTHNVSQSAYACGFSNLSYFSKTYQKILGHKPISDIPKHQ